MCDLEAGIKSIFAASALLALTPQPGMALTCDELVDAVHASSAADLLPELDVRQIDNLPDGWMEVTNLRNIDTGMSCPSGEFDGFGATLSAGSEPDRLRFAALISALLEAIAPDEPGRLKLAAELQAEALDKARKEEIRTGIYIGFAEAKLGGFDLTVGAQKGMMQIDITAR